MAELGPKNSNSQSIPANQDDSFRLSSVVCVFISLVAILADLATDILVFAEYCKGKYIYWALATILFILIPNVLVNTFSLKWYLTDRSCKIKHWITHLLLVGLLERFVGFLHKVFACKNLQCIKIKDWEVQKNDLRLLHFIYIFTGTVPQIIVQIYAIIILHDNHYTKGLALSASISSVIWGCLSYICTSSNNNIQWRPILLKLCWHIGLLIGRITSIILFAIIFGFWTLLPLGLHWCTMTLWIILQNTSFCPNMIEEVLYNIVMGLIYCFFYVNLQEGATRYRLIIFNFFLVTQNLGSLFIFVLVTDSDYQRKSWSIVAIVCILVGTFIGIAAMLLYYRYYHYKVSLEWKETTDIELRDHISEEKKDCGFNYLRSFKTVKKERIHKPTVRENGNLQQKDQIESHRIRDKNDLIENFRTKTTANNADISMDMSSIQFYSVENTPQIIQNESYRKKGITMNKVCPPTELTLKLSSIEDLESSIDEITSTNIHLQKRRGICSSDELREDIMQLNLDECDIVGKNFIKSDSEISPNETAKKTSSDSIDMDLDLSFSDINSSDINTFNENIVQKLCLSALKNIKVGNRDADIENIQRIALDILKEMYAKKDKSKSKVCIDSLPKRDLDTPTEVLSVHDYENICAVNIAREAWGLRSWKAYCDIENWLHDGSVVRERNRDTFTSGSSEISSCRSQELKNAILSASPFLRSGHTYSNVFVKYDHTQDEYICTDNKFDNDDTFQAKPVVIDTNRDINFLEPILEELDDLGDKEPNKKLQNSVSSLVATIDEIRKTTVTNSPRDLYHRREHLWDSPQFDNTSKKSESNLKKTLWKEPSKLDFINIMESFPEKENVCNVSQDRKFDLHKLNTKTKLSNSNSSASASKFITMQSPDKTSKLQNDKVSYKPQQQFQDLSNKHIDFLWQLVNENNIPLNSNENLSINRRTSSLQSLIKNDTPPTVLSTPTSKVSNNLKKGKSKPRRKFSLLREKFEPKTYSDEETLYRSTDKLCPYEGVTSKSSSKNSIIDYHCVNIQNEPDLKKDASNTLTASGTKSLLIKHVVSPTK